MKLSELNLFDKQFHYPHRAPESKQTLRLVFMLAGAIIKLLQYYRHMRHPQLTPQLTSPYTRTYGRIELAHNTSKQSCAKAIPHKLWIERKKISERTISTRFAWDVLLINSLSTGQIESRELEDLIVTSKESSALLQLINTSKYLCCVAMTLLEITKRCLLRDHVRERIRVKVDNTNLNG